MFIDTTLKINIIILLHIKKTLDNIMPGSTNEQNVSETLTGLFIISQKLLENKLDMPTPKFIIFALYGETSQSVSNFYCAILGIMQRDLYSNIVIDIMVYVN